MPGRQRKGKTRCTRTVLRIPDLEQSKGAVINSLPAKTSQESYAHAIDEFIAWYSRPTVVTSAEGPVPSGVPSAAYRVLRNVRFLMIEPYS